MSKNKLALAAVIILLASNLFLAAKLYESRKGLEGCRTEFADNEGRNPFIEFNRLFVEKVLQAEEEVNFDTRLQLENKVRELKDAEMLDQWNRFVNAQDEGQAQIEVKKLLGLLAERMER